MRSVAPPRRVSGAGGGAAGRQGFVDASRPPPFEVAVSAIVVAIGVVGSMPGSTPCMTQTSKSSLRGVGRRAFGLAPTTSRAWEAENGAINGDAVTRTIHAAQNLERNVGCLQHFPWFRARDIVG
jgi:hypothetical protein